MNREIKTLKKDICNELVEIKGGKMKGIITKTVGGFFFVADDDNKIHKTIIRGKIQKEVFPGDYVEFYVNEDIEEKVIERIYPRDNMLKRPKIANVNQVIIMQSFKEPPFDQRLLDRFLIMAESKEIRPMVVLNKSDLIENDVNMIYNVYNKTDYELFPISVKNNQGLNKLLKKLTGSINVLAGPSGVGKTSLINQLIPDADLPVKAVSKNIKRGIHTTRHVELLSLNKGGWIVDTPGFTSLNIDHLLPQELSFLYPEFRPFLNQCRFNMCSHTHEPDCAIKKAVENDEISKKRYQSYKMFFQELKEKEEQIYD